MNLKSLSPSMLILLGLSTEACVQACLTPPYDETTSTTSPPTTEVGPCLTPLPPDSSDDSFTTSPTGSTGTGSGSTGSGADTGTTSDPTGTGTGSGSGTGLDSSSGTDADSGSVETTAGPCLTPRGIVPEDSPGEDLATPDAPTPPVGSRRAAVERVLDRLPADVASRLRTSLDD